MIACPKCTKYMFPRRREGVEIDLCSGCHGVWLDRSELASITHQAADLPDAREPQPTSFSCPRCGAPLQERPYSGRSGLLVDVCTSCRGIYLDDGELGQVEDLARRATTAFPPERRDRLKRQAARREALTAIYKTRSPVAKRPATDRAVFVRRVYSLLVATLLVTAAGSVVGIRSGLAAPLFGPGIILEILLCVAVVFCRRVSGVNLGLLFAYTFVSGFTLSAVLLRFISMGKANIVWEALAVTAGIFVLLSVYVHVTRQDLDWMGGFLFACLSGLVLSGLLFLFLGGSFARFMWSLTSAVIFSGYILYDTSNIVLKYETDEVVAATLDLYLDVVNLFLDLLRVLSYLEG